MELTNPIINVILFAMTRLQDRKNSGVGSPTHLLWLATMGLKDNYFIIDDRDGTDKVYNNGMRFIAYDLLMSIKKHETI